MMLLALAMYQVFSPDIYSEKTFPKHCMEFATVMSCYFYFCHMSERWQGCNDYVRRAMEDSCWYQYSSYVQRNVIMIYVRVFNTQDYPMALGLFKACYDYYVGSVKLAYTFFNFITLKKRST
ncbi:hypothetical protein WDU94_003890 [Cyamophila willieti]